MACCCSAMVCWRPKAGDDLEVEREAQPRRVELADGRDALRRRLHGVDEDAGLADGLEAVGDGLVLLLLRRRGLVHLDVERRLRLMAVPALQQVVHRLEERACRRRRATAARRVQSRAIGLPELRHRRRGAGDRDRGALIGILHLGVESERVGRLAGGEAGAAEKHGSRATYA